MGFLSAIAKSKETKEKSAQYERFKEAVSSVHQSEIDLFENIKKEEYPIFLQEQAKDYFFEAKGRAFEDNNFSIFKEIPKKVITHPEFQKNLEEFEIEACEVACKMYFEENEPITWGLNYVNMIDELIDNKNKINKALKHLQYFLDEDPGFYSLITPTQEDEDPITFISAAGAMDFSEEKNLITKFLEENKEARNFFESGDFVSSLLHLSRADYDEELFSDAILYYWNLCITKLLSDNSSGDLNRQIEGCRKGILNLKRSYQEIKDENGNVEEISIWPTDIIIGEIYSRAKSHSYTDIQDELNKFYKYVAINQKKLELAQLEIIRKVLEHLNQKEQELILLNSMVENGIPISDDLQIRRAFLEAAKDDNEYSQKTGGDYGSLKLKENELVYDYRALSWTDKEAEEYFRNLYNTPLKFSDVNTIPQIPLVLNEWSENLKFGSSNWELSSFISFLNNELSENMIDEYLLEIKQVASYSTSQLDFEEAIVISTLNPNAKFPFLTFIVSINQLTRKEIGVSVHCCYSPEKDNKVKKIGEVSETEKVEQLSNARIRFIDLKNSLNPKAVQYIKLMKNSLIEAIQDYLNSSKLEASIY